MTRSSTLNRCAEIDGVSGDENIAELFANKYQDIYNSYHVNASELRELRSVIESRLQTEDSISISCIKLDEVTDALKSWIPTNQMGIMAYIPIICYYPAFISVSI